MRLFTLLDSNGSLILNPEDPVDHPYTILRTLGILNYYRKGGDSVLEFDKNNVVLTKTNNKYVFKSKTLPKVINFHTISEQSLRLFACDCAEHVLHIYEKQYPNDDRPRKAIEISRKYARGLATEEELREVEDIAWSAEEAAQDNIKNDMQKALKNANNIIAINDIQAARDAWHVAICVCESVCMPSAAHGAPEYCARNAANAYGRTFTNPYSGNNTTSNMYAQVLEREWQEKRLEDYLDGKVV